MVVFPTHLAKRLTRLSGLVPSGTCAATWGSWVLLLATMPLISAARVATCRATRPVGSLGYPCVKAFRMARYWRRLSLIVCSFKCVSLNMEYTMGQPLKRPSHNYLEKCPVVNFDESIHLLVVSALSETIEWTEAIPSP